MKDPKKILRETTWRTPRGATPVHNPVKDGLWRVWWFFKTFWAVLLFGLIMWWLYTYGPQYGFIPQR